MIFVEHALQAKKWNAYFESLPDNTSKSITREKRIIPVVFHVIHNNGSENISREQIEDQMKILNGLLIISNRRILKLKN